MSKQSKQYESMRQTQANTFSDGLNMDLHPLTTPNTILTDCVNGTMITYNDNEFVLQNERGNIKIDNAKLSPGFIPVGMKEHNGILYIVSHNPQTKESEIGTFPSPANISNFLDNTWNENITTKSSVNYSEINTQIQYYDYNLEVSNYDKYKLYQNKIDNPLFVLEHYILTEDGKSLQLDLKDDDKEHRFSHVGKGILGYKYRPFYIDSFNAYITKIQDAHNAKLFLEFSTLDQELISMYKSLEIKCTINVKLSNSKNEIDFLKKEIIFVDFEQFHNLQGNANWTLQFNDLLDGVKYKYDSERGLILYDNETYDNMIFEIIFSIHKDDYSIIMNHLTKTVKESVSSIIQPIQIFSQFKYKKNDNENLDILAVLDLKKYDIYSEMKISDLKEASFKLLKIDNNGNVEGQNVINTYPMLNTDTYSVGEILNNKYDLVSAKIDDTDENSDKIYYFQPSNIEGTIPVSMSKNNMCNNLFEVKNATKVQYIKWHGVDNIILLDDKYKILSIKEYTPCEGDETMVDKRFDEETETITYEIKDVKYEPNSVYLLQLSFPLGNKNNIASFIVITTDQMLTNEHYNDIERMDMLSIDDWYTSNISYSSYLDDNSSIVTNDTIYPENKIPIYYINRCQSNEEIESLARRFFLKFNSLFEVNKIKDEIPSISHAKKYYFELKSNDEDFDVRIEIENGIGDINYVKTGYDLYNKVSLYKESESESVHQTSERKYIYDIFKNDWIDLNTIKAGKPFTSGNLGGPKKQSMGIKDAIGLEYPHGIYYTRHYGSNFYYKNEVIDWISTTGTISTFEEYRRQRTGRCDDFGATLKHTYTFIKPDASLYGATIQLMKSINMNNSMCYSKISNAKHVTYSGNKEKIWMHGKFDNDNYVLIGMNLLRDKEETKYAWEVLKKHLYYINPVDKTVVQYTYSNNLDYSQRLNVNGFKYRIIPMPCIAMDKNMKSYNVQSWNNLNYNNLDYSDEINIDVEIDGLSINPKYEKFLSYLVKFLNDYQIPVSMLQEQQSNDLLKSDFSEVLLTENLQSKTLKPSEVQLHYDIENEILYKFTDSEHKDVFEYSSSPGCMEPLDWNYSEDFCWNVEHNTLDELNNYHSIQFYKLSSYEPK